MTDATLSTIGRNEPTFGVRQVAIIVMWLGTFLASLPIMGGLVIQAMVGRLIALGILLLVAVVFHVALRPSKPPTAPRRAPTKQQPSDVVDRIHRQLLGPTTGGAPSVSR